MFLFMGQGELFPVSYELATDAAITEALGRAVAAAARLPRSIELHLNLMCAKHLLAELRLADLDIVRKPRPSLRE